MCVIRYLVIYSVESDGFLNPLIQMTDNTSDLWLVRFLSLFVPHAYEVQLDDQQNDHIQREVVVNEVLQATAPLDDVVRQFERNIRILFGTMAALYCINDYMND